jgi:hypothetical protein
MSDASEFSTAVRTVHSYINDVDDTIERRVIKDYSGETTEVNDLSTLEADIGAPEDTTDDASDPLILIHCSRQSNYYGVMAKPKPKYFSVRYLYSFVKSLAAQIQDNTDSESFLRDRGINIESDESEAVAKRAAIELLADFGESNLAELEYQLMDHILRDDVSADIRWESIDGGTTEVIKGFQVYTQLFPYESTFSASEFNSQVQKIITLGRRGSNFINYSFNLDKVVQQADIEW